MAALARGARINRDLINKKLQSHNLPYLQGSHIEPGENDDVNKLLHILGLDTKARVCAMFPYDPYGRPIDAADYLIIGYEWNFVLHAKEVEEALPRKEIPTGFEDAVRQIDPEARHDVWCVAGMGEEGLKWSDVAESNVFTCGLDQQTFRTWAEFSAHNVAAHDLAKDHLPYA